MSQKIKFNPVDELTDITVPHPKPASEYLPEWLQKATPFFTKTPEFAVETGKPNVTFKMCMPFTDTFNMGYIQETWTDIWIDQKPDGVYFYFPAGPKIMSERPLMASSMMPSIPGFYENHYTWHPPWLPELPPGYSCIITHPLNRSELPFQVFSGIIESDTFYTSEQQSNIPFILREGFSGMIKKGTPMYQIIPFKREDWVSSANKHDHVRQLTMTQKIRQFAMGGYKKLHWKKKNFS